ncbi:MAG: hypothetical protein U9P10_15950 [Thermodesulfobacteriota bacterium]|nr:hypothetical protein [Thermodesulfobacteriota bacterium]
MKRYKIYMVSLFLTLICTCMAFGNYESTYENIQWGNRGGDTYYCIDICDKNWNVYEGLRAVACGEDLHNWSPKHFVTVDLGVEDLPSGFTFNWIIWSSSGYGGEGFQGQVVVGDSVTPVCKSLPYLSTYEKIQWGCRGNDTFYCIDIFDKNWRMLYQAVKCEEGLHSYSPQYLDLSSGDYYWKVWSYSGYGENNFWGEFSVAPEVPETKSENFIGTWIITIVGFSKSQYYSKVEFSANGYLTYKDYISGNLEKSGTGNWSYDENTGHLKGYADGDWASGVLSGTENNFSASGEFGGMPVIYNFQRQ